jgi:hypothetical protein
LQGVTVELAFSPINIDSPVQKLLIPELMKLTIDDLPMVKVATLVGGGLVGPGDKTALVRFGDDGVEYQVGVTRQQLPAGGFWMKFACPRCGGNAQRLRLLDAVPACGKCVRASGLIYRSQATRTEKRHVVTAPKRIANLNAGGGFRVHRPTRKLERRASVELALRQSLLVPRRFGVAEFEKTLKKLRKR